MAGLPEGVILQAQKFLKELEKTNPAFCSTENVLTDRQHSGKTISQGKKGQLSLFPEMRAETEILSHKERKIIEEIRALNLVNITPLEALVKLFSLQNRLVGQALHKEKDR